MLSATRGQFSSSPRSSSANPGEASRLGCIAPARAMQRSDVLERDQDVPVQLDTSDLVDGVVRGQDAVLVIAAEERDLDLLPLYLLV